MELKVEQEIWLNRHGGRTEKDVFVDEEGKLFVVMFRPPTNLNPLDYEEVYLPQI